MFISNVGSVGYRGAARSFGAPDVLSRRPRLIELLLLVVVYYYYYYYYYYYRYSALGPVWAEARAQSGDWYSSGTLHPGQVLRGSLPLLSPANRITYSKNIAII